MNEDQRRDPDPADNLLQQRRQFLGNLALGLGALAAAGLRGMPGQSFLLRGMAGAPIPPGIQTITVLRRVVDSGVVMEDDPTILYWERGRYAPLTPPEVGSGTFTGEWATSWCWTGYWTNDNSQSVSEYHWRTPPQSGSETTSYDGDWLSYTVLYGNPGAPATITTMGITEWTYTTTAHKIGGQMAEIQEDFEAVDVDFTDPYAKPILPLLTVEQVDDVLDCARRLGPASPPFAR